MQLTDKQQEVFNYITHYFETHQKAPTYEQLQNHFGFASKSSVYRHLQTLKNKGLIRMSKKGTYTISVQNKDKADLKTFPLPLLGALNDEGQIEAVDEEQKILCSSSKNLSPNCYALKIQSGNYLEAGLLHQDIVIVEPRGEARTGETILGYAYGERYMIKKYHPQGPYTRLDSFCVQIEPMIVTPEELSIQGIILGVIRTY